MDSLPVGIEPAGKAFPGHALKGGRRWRATTVRCLVPFSRPRNAEAQKAVVAPSPQPTRPKCSNADQGASSHATHKVPVPSVTPKIRQARMTRRRQLDREDRDVVVRLYRLVAAEYAAP